MNEKLKDGLLVFVAIAVLLIGVKVFSTSKVVKGLGGAQTSATYVTDQSITTNLDSGFYWGNLEVAGTTYLDGAIKSAGVLTTGGIVDAISTSSATYTLAASDICNSSEIAFTPLGAATTVTLPATSTLFASCLGTVGQSIRIFYTSVATSTVLAAGAGGTLLTSSSSTVAAAKFGILSILHDATNTYKVLLTNYPN